MNSERRVVITGLGVVSPLGIGIDTVWDGLITGRCGLGPIRSFDASGLAIQIVGESPDLNMGDYVPKHYRKSTKVMSRDIQMAVAAAYEAVKDAGLRTRCLIERGEAEEPSNVVSTRFGANIGAGLICADLPELAGALVSATGAEGEFRFDLWGTEGMNNLTPLWLLKFLPNMLACHVTIVHDAQGLSNTITCGEASSHLAIGEAFRTIARRAEDVCICGGAEGKVNPMGIVRPQLCGRLANHEERDPTKSCRPFSADPSGIVPADGAGLMILESLDHAQARGARIYAELVGFGAAANVKDWNEPDPAGESIALAINKALQDAGIQPRDINLIATFGSGSHLHDASELAALDTVFGDHLSDIPALAIKGAIGSNGAGSGAIDLAVAIKALCNNTVPPSQNTGNPVKGCRLRLNSQDPVDARIDYILGYSHAFSGGQSAALVIRRFEESSGGS